MRKNLLFVFLTCIALGFAACDDDDNNNGGNDDGNGNSNVEIAISDIDLWQNTAKVTLTNATADDTVQYRVKDASAWQNAIANEDGTFTIAPVWEEGKNDAGLTIYTPTEGTGVWAGKTYEYRVVNAGKEIVAPATFETEAGDVIPNGDMSAWSTKVMKDLLGKDTDVSYPNAEGESFWDSGNNGVTKSLCTNDEAFGCAKLASMNMLVLASGNLFTGEFVMSGMSGTVNFGQSYTYTARPTALKLRYHATIGKVDISAATLGLQGVPTKIDIKEPDSAVIYVAIIDWSERHPVTSGLAGADTGKGSWNPATMEGLDAEKEKVIAYGLYDITSSTDGEDLIDLTIPLNFYDKDAAIPTGNYTLVISCSCSKYGDYLNGCSTNVMYVDDFQWVY